MTTQSIRLGIVAVVLLAGRPALSATVAVLPVEGEVDTATRAQVAEGLRRALTERSHVVVPQDEVERAIFHQGRPEDLDGLGRLAAGLRADAVLRLRMTPRGEGRHGLEVSVFWPSPPRVELLEQEADAVGAVDEVRAMLDQLLGVTTAAQPAEAAPESAPGPGPEAPAGTPAGEGDAASEDGGEESGEGAEPDEPAEQSPRVERPAYGSRPLEVGLYGGPTVLLTELPPFGQAVGGRLGVGLGYCFVDWLGVGIRADILFYLGNADAFGATVGSGVHYAPFRGIPLYVGFRLGLGVLQAAAGSRDTFFLMRPEPVVAYRFGRWIQLEARPASFSMLFGSRTIIQYEALLGVAVTLGT